MNGFFLVSAILLIVAVVLVVAALRQTKKKYSAATGTEKQVSNEECAIKNLEVLDNRKASIPDKARAAARLIQCSYVLVNVIGNQGGTFNERKHTESFCGSLSPDYFKALKTLVDGQDG